MTRKGHLTCHVCTTQNNVHMTCHTIHLITPKSRPFADMLLCRTEQLTLAVLNCTLMLVLYKVPCMYSPAAAEHLTERVAGQINETEGGYFIILLQNITAECLAEKYHF